MILFVVVAAYLLFMYFSRWARKTSSNFDHFIFSVVLLIVAGLATFFVGLIPPTKDVPDQQYEITNISFIRQPEAIHGILGSGYEYFEEHYNYSFVVNSDFNQEANVVTNNPNHAIVLVSYDQEPGKMYVVIYKKDYLYDWFKYISFVPNTTGPTTYEFHLPVGYTIPEIIIQPAAE